MQFISLFVLCLVPLALRGGQSPASHAGHVPHYTADGRLASQPDYREWVYLTSGLDMSYTPGMAAMGGQSTFDNVFVNPEAYRAFLQTGAWPDKTMLLLEHREAQSKASINKAGHFQGQGPMGIEVHVKDAARGGWSFYEFSEDAPGKRVPDGADCYSCHRDHAAVDTTFVQFYPTLLPISKQKGTLSASYLRDEAKPAH